MAAKKKTTQKEKAKGKKPAKGKKTAKPRKPAKAQPPLTKAMVKAWGFDCENMTAAALNYKGNLVGRLERSGPLRQAWQRGRFLRDISQLAAVGMTKAEVAVRLDIELAAFEDMLIGPEAADIWTRAQIETLVQLKTGILESAMQGKGPALKSFERILQDDRPASSLDVYRMTEKQMLAVTGVTRQTLHTWVTEKALSRNSDKSFDLRVFIRWFEGFSQRKVNVNPKVASEDEMRNIKTADLKRKLDAELGKLLDREEVIAGLVARQQWENQFYDQNIESVCQKCGPLPPAGVREILDKFHDQRRLELSKVNIELQLGDKLQAEFEKFLKKIE